MALKTFLKFQGVPMQHLYDTDSLDLISGFRGML